MSLTLDEAQKALNAALAKAREMNVKMAIAVVDDHGEVLASARMDGVQGWVIEMSRGKAMASVFSFASLVAHSRSDQIRPSFKV